MADSHNLVVIPEAAVSFIPWKITQPHQAFVSQLHHKGTPFAFLSSHRLKKHAFHCCAASFSHCTIQHFVIVIHNEMKEWFTVTWVIPWSWVLVPLTVFLHHRKTFFLCAYPLLPLVWRRLGVINHYATASILAKVHCNDDNRYSNYQQCGWYVPEIS